jgi:hypothetical protein
MHIVSAINEFSFKFFDPVVFIIFVYLCTRYRNHILHVLFDCFTISFTSVINLCELSCFVTFLCAYNIYFIYNIGIIVKVIYKRNNIC